MDIRRENIKAALGATDEQVDLLARLLEARMVAGLPGDLSSIMAALSRSKPYALVDFHHGNGRRRRGAGYTKRRVCKRTGKSSSRRRP